MLLCATPLHAMPPTQNLWLDAEATLKQPTAFDTWHNLYEAFEKQRGSLSDDVAQHDVIVAQLVALSVRDHDFALAEEMAQQIEERGLRLYLLLATHRAHGIYSRSAQAEAILALLPQAEELWGENEAFYHFLSALTTALLDTTREDRGALSAQIIPLLEKQHIARHRAYALHRLHLYRAAATKPSTLDVQRSEALIATNQYDAALHAIAVAPLHEHLGERNRLLLSVHEAMREDTKTAHHALSALWLMMKDKEQERALVDYVGWLAEHKKLAEAETVTAQLHDRKAIIKAMYHLRDGYAALKQEEQRKAAIERIDTLKSVIENAPLSDIRTPQINPFQTLRPYHLLTNARNANARLDEKGKAICTANTLPLPALPQPFSALSADDSYGTDNAANDISWTVMLLTSRALTGDVNANAQLKSLLLTWAKANALEKTSSHHNALYALKRVLLPFLQATSVVESKFSPDEKMLVLDWLDTLTQLATQHFEGKEVDMNNHRYLADAVLLADGIVRASPARYNEGKQGFYRAIAQIDAAGDLPLEAARGSRALWYMRQSLSSLTTMAYMMQQQGDVPSPHAMQALQRLAHRFINAAYNPLLLLPKSSANVTAGEESNIFNTDMGMLHTRPHIRHYMAFVDYWRVLAPNSTVNQRFSTLLSQYATGSKPWIDEFAGGNVECYIKGLP